MVSADIKHGHPRLQAKFCGDMGFFLHLRLFKRVIRVDEIPAGILPVSIKEQIVQHA